MGLETSLYTVLSGDAPVAALVATRIRPEVGYPEELATISYSTTDEPVYHSTGMATCRRARVTITCWGLTKDSSDAIFDAVKAAIETTSAPKTFGDVWMQTIRRTQADASAVAITVSSANTPDWWIRSMEYFAVWQ